VNRWLFFFFFALFCGFAIESYFQRSRSDLVIDEDKVSLLLVALAVNKKTKATTTDLDGRYTISVKEGEKLRFSYLGMPNPVLLIITI